HRQQRRLHRHRDGRRLDQSFRIVMRALILAFCLGLGLAVTSSADEALANGAQPAGDLYRGAAYGGVKRNDPLSGRGFTVSRITDIATLQSARDNQLVGYGLVIGVQGTGDGLRNSPFTEQSVRAMLENLGIS